MNLRACATLAVLIGVSGCSLIRGGDTTPSRTAAFDQAILASDAADFEREQQLLATVAAICPVDGLGRRASLLLAASELDPRNPERRPDVAARIAALHITRGDADDWSRPLARSLYLHALDLGARPVSDDDVGVFWSAYALGYPEPARSGRPADDDAVPIEADDADEDGADEAADGTPLGERAEIALAGPRCNVPPRDPSFELPELEGESLASRLMRLQGAPPPEQPAQQLSADVAALQAEVRQLRAQLDEKEQELSRIRRTLRP